MTLWASRVNGALVVIEADDVVMAQRESGLVVEEFHRATDDELDEWDLATDVPLNNRDIETLKRMVRAELRGVGRRRIRDRESGRWNGESAGDDASGDANRHKAVKLLEVIGKLEALEAEEADVSEPG